MDGIKHVIRIEDVIGGVCDLQSPLPHLNCDWLDRVSMKRMFQARPLPLLIFPLHIYAKMEAAHGSNR